MQTKTVPSGGDRRDKDTKSVLLFEIGFDIFVKFAGVVFGPAHEVFAAHAEQRGADAVAESELFAAGFEEFKAVADHGC